MHTRTRMVKRIGTPRRYIPLVIAGLLWQPGLPARAWAEARRSSVRLPAGEVLDRHGGASDVSPKGAAGAVGPDERDSNAGESELSLPEPQALSARLDSQDAPARRQTASEEAVGAGADELKPSPDTLIRHRSSPSGTTKQSDEKRALSRAEPSASSTWATLWPLLVVLTLIGAIAYVIKRFTPARRMLTGAGVVDIVARTPVSAKQSLVLAKMGQRLVLIGVCPDRITALAHVDDPDEAALLLGQAASGREDSISHQFVHAFREQASAYAEPDDDEDQMRPPAGSVRSLLERVRQLAKKRGVA